MKRFVAQNNPTQGFLLPQNIDEYVRTVDPVPAIEAIVEERDRAEPGIEEMRPEATGPPR